MTQQQVKRYTPTKAIRAKCLYCMMGSTKEVGLCHLVGCEIYGYRRGRRGPEATATPLKAIHAKCLECSAGVLADVRACDVVDCPLMYYRMGKVPHRKSEEWHEKQEKLITRTRTAKKRALMGH